MGYHLLESFSMPGPRHISTKCYKIPHTFFLSRLSLVPKPHTQQFHDLVSHHLHIGAMFIIKTCLAEFLRSHVELLSFEPQEPQLCIAQDFILLIRRQLVLKKP